MEYMDGKFMLRDHTMVRTTYTCNIRNANGHFRQFTENALGLSLIQKINNAD